MQTRQLKKSATELTNQAAVVELLDQVEVHGLLRDPLPFIQIAVPVGYVVVMSTTAALRRATIDNNA